VGVADRADGAVDNRKAGKFGRDEKGAFDVDMGVDEAGKDILAGSFGYLGYGSYLTVLYDELGGIYLLSENVY